MSLFFILQWHLSGGSRGLSGRSLLILRACRLPKWKRGTRSSHRAETPGPSRSRCPRRSVRLAVVRFAYFASWHIPIVTAVFALRKMFFCFPVHGVKIGLFRSVGGYPPVGLPAWLRTSRTFSLPPNPNNNLSLIHISEPTRPY